MTTPVPISSIPCYGQIRIINSCETTTTSPIDTIIRSSAPSPHLSPLQGSIPFLDFIPQHSDPILIPIPKKIDQD